MTKTKFPEYLYVRIDKDNDGSDIILNFEDETDALEDGALTSVATYQRVDVRKGRLIAQFQTGHPRLKLVRS